MSTVLLVMDIQKKMMESIPQAAPALLGKIRQAMAGARAAGIPVVHVKLSFRPGYPEVSKRNKGFSALAQSGGLFTETHEGTDIHPEVAPLEGEIVVTKKRISAFAGSDLAVVLSALNASHLVITGYATSGIVLNTVREAADKDYELSVLSDGCADSDAEVHEFLMQKIFARQAAIKTVDEWTGDL